MTTNKISGSLQPDPSKHTTASHKTVAHAIDPTQAIDADKQGKKNQFQDLMNPKEEKSAKESLLPSPFESIFHPKDPIKAPIAGPANSPPPKVEQTLAKHPLQTQDLPQAREFWEQINLPDEPIGAFPLQEQKKSASEEKPIKKQSSKEPSGQYWQSQAIMEQTPSDAPADHTNVDARPNRSKSEQHPNESKPKTARNFTSALQPTVEKERHPGAKKPGVELIAPSIPALPTDVQPVAQMAAAQAAPYLSDHIVPLFYQMVGTITVMSQTPDIQTTEVMLNAPNFAHSKFFGSTIEITKYATAPDSFNIRLTGSNEAVNSFQQNIPSLMSAFQRESIVVNRIEAHYTSVERPLVRRKESASSSSDQGGP